MYCSMTGVAPNPERRTTTSFPLSNGRSGRMLFNISSAISSADFKGSTLIPGSP